MSTVISVIELAVGAGCLAVALVMWRRSSEIRWVAGLLGVAGVAALVHATFALA